MHVLIRPDLGPQIGAGHAMRCLALAEALVERGHRVTFACDTAGLDWVRTALEASGAAVAELGGRHLARLVADLQPTVIVVDSYTSPGEEYAAAIALGIPLAAVVDQQRRGAVADLLIDPGPARAEDWEADRAAGQRLLVGPDYALVRREFARPSAPHQEPVPLRVLVTFGGTDALGMAPLLAGLVLETGRPVDLTVLARPDLAAAAASLPVGSGQRLTVRNPGTGFAQLVAAHDVVISASGSTSWELLAMGAAAGFICVADNQEPYYDWLRESGAGVPLGHLAQVREDPARTRAALTTLLDDPSRRAALRQAGARQIDGRGPDRLVDALIDLSGRAAD